MKLSFLVLCFVAVNGSAHGYGNAFEVEWQQHSVRNHFDQVNYPSYFEKVDVGRLYPNYFEKVDVGRLYPNYFEKVDVGRLYRKLNSLEEKIDRYVNSLKDTRQYEDATLNAASIFDIRVDTFPEKCMTSTLPRSCAEATACTRRSGIYKILVETYSTEPFLVECDVKTEGGGWTLIQRRQDGSVDFYRNWTEYQKGFGNVEGEFFIGLDKLFALTNFNGPQELLIILRDKNETRKAFYNNFVIGSERSSYDLLHLGDYSGDAGDSLSFQLGAKFTTRDKNNSKYGLNCARIYTGAWWYKDCHASNLNGKYGDDEYGKGVSWSTFRGYNKSIPHATMMIRRRSF